MASSGTKHTPAGHGAAQFATTHWSVVRAAGHGSDQDARRALERLCQAYWYPLYAYVRRRGYGLEDAQDLTQEFFALLLRRGCFSLPNPARGKFRTFLLAALSHFLADEWNRRHTQKRGGDYTFLSWGQEEAERHYAAEPIAVLTPDQLFERRWAATLLERVLAKLEKECQSNGRLEFFIALKDTLWGEKTASDYAELAQRWGMTEAAVKGAAHRLRHRYRELVQEEIAHTVSSPDEIESEVRDLIAALSR